MAPQLHTCSKCGERKPVKLFYRNRAQPGGLNVWCKNCHQAYCAKNAHKKKKYAKRYYIIHAEKAKRLARVHRKKNGAKMRALDKQKHRKDPRAKMLKAARRRAKDRGLKFGLNIENISVPKFCPLLGIRIAVGNGSHCAGSPTLDRKNPKKGYVRGNVWVISHRANSIKRDATVQELRTLATNLGRILK